MTIGELRGGGPLTHPHHFFLHLGKEREKRRDEDHTVLMVNIYLYDYIV